MAYAAGVDAARRRVAVTLDAARLVDLERLIVGVSRPDTDAARRGALSAANAAGRSALVHEARQAALTYVIQAFSTRAFSGTWAATEMSMSVTRPADRAAVAEALADAVTADAVEDLIDAEAADALRASWTGLATAGLIPEPGSLSGLTSALAVRRRMSVGAAIVILLIGVGVFLAGNVLGIAFLAAAAGLLWNALRGRGG